MSHWTQEERAEVGKHVLLYGIKSAVFKLQSKYPEQTHQAVTDCKKVMSKKQSSYYIKQYFLT